MTFSMIARDAETGYLGVATATGKIAVGAQVPHLRPGIGAIATQGFTTNPLYAEDGFRLLEAGRSAKEVVQALTDSDEGRERRQLIVMDRDGGTAGATGSTNKTRLGINEADNLIIGGNMLASDRVLPAVEEAFRQSTGRPLAERLLAALKAGDAEGGDKRGTCSAAMLAQDNAPWPLNLRVDFAKDPLAALEDLYERSTEASYQNFRRSLPNRAAPQ